MTWQAMNTTSTYDRLIGTLKAPSLKQQQAGDALCSRGWKHKSAII